MKSICFCIAAVLSAPAQHVSIPSRIIRHVTLCTAICFSHIDRDYAFPVSSASRHYFHLTPLSHKVSLSLHERTHFCTNVANTTRRAGLSYLPCLSLVFLKWRNCGTCCSIGGLSALLAASRFLRVTRTLLSNIQIVQPRLNRCINLFLLCIQPPPLQATSMYLGPTSSTPLLRLCRISS